jgi:hypothetical protein
MPSLAVGEPPEGWGEALAFRCFFAHPTGASLLYFFYKSFTPSKNNYKSFVCKGWIFEA